MKITLVCNCGLLLQCGGQSLLVDAPNAAQPPFFAFPELEQQKLLTAQPPYDGMMAFAFTHTHEDHFCREKLLRVLRERGNPSVFLPDGCTPQQGKLLLGGFLVEFHRLVHTTTREQEHFVLLVSCGGKTVYITADAEPDLAQHKKILGGRRCDAAFWNGQYLSYPATRALLHEAARMNYIYHIPVDAADSSGIRRKCEKNMQRFAGELTDTSLLEQYPSVLHMEDEI